MITLLRPQLRATRENKSSANNFRSRRINEEALSRPGQTFQTRDESLRSPSSLGEVDLISSLCQTTRNRLFAAMKNTQIRILYIRDSGRQQNSPTAQDSPTSQPTLARRSHSSWPIGPRDHGPTASRGAGTCNSRPWPDRTQTGGMHTRRATYTYHPYVSRHRNSPG